jgi:hypothetical protein
MEDGIVLNALLKDMAFVGDCPKTIEVIFHLHSFMKNRLMSQRDRILLRKRSVMAVSDTTGEASY